MQAKLKCAQPCATAVCGPEAESFGPTLVLLKPIFYLIALMTQRLSRPRSAALDSGLNPLRPTRLTRSAVGLAALAALGTSALLTGCSTIEGVFTGEKVDYKSQSKKTGPLDVPPDLTQLAREGRYKAQDGSPVTASGSAAAPANTPNAVATVNTPALVAPAAVGDIRVERRGTQRWLVVPATPEQLWPQLKAFWLDRGFTLDVESPESGVLETGWAENRAKIPEGILRTFLGKALDTFYSTGERDRYRTRLERVGNTTEIYVSHRGMMETTPTVRDPVTIWVSRPSDPDLEAEFLTKLMVKLGTKEDQAKQAVASAAEVAAKARAAEAPASPPTSSAAASKAAASNTATTMVVDDPFDRAWRRVGLGLDRSGFTVEDRDRAAGIFYVRYVDPNNLPKEENIFRKLFSTDDAGKAVRYRVLVQANGTDKSVVSVQTAQGAAETGEVAQRIIGMLMNQLK